MWHFSNAYAIAASSPSIGAYLHLASMQNLLPLNIKYQPTGQQIRALSVVHEQCFCRWMKPILSLLQSGARQVTWSFSNVMMPFQTKSTCLEGWNAACRADSKMCESCLMSMIGPSEYTQATWLTRPQHDLASVNVLGLKCLKLPQAWTQKGSPQRALSGGPQTALHPGRTGICPCWVSNEAWNWRCERRLLWCWSCRAGCHLWSSLWGGYPLIFRHTRKCRHLQMQGSLGASWSTWISLMKVVSGWVSLFKETGVVLKLFSFV